ncbi:MAG: hypothetical protein KC487_00570, partial [Anaerolineae bacterium]|nr:hypothetical protein [Anaerolineae bacterium]
LIMVGFLLLIIAFALILSVRTVTGRSSKKPKAVKAEAPEPVSPDPRDPLRELEREMEAS